MDDEDTIFDERVRTLVRFEAALRPGVTINPRTLLAIAGVATLDEADRVDSARSPPPSRRHVDTDINPEELPRVSLDAIAKAPPTDTLPPDSDYELLAMLGEGGMGRVHLAYQRSLARDVAVKSLRDDAPPAVARALLREARLTGSLEHPGVIPVHALGVDDAKRPILVMKRVDGVDLSALLAKRAGAASSSPDASGDRLFTPLEILAQVCLTVEFAHSRGVIHRDIKPENVMVGGFGEVYLLDWGIAATSEDKDDASDPMSPIVGTPAYMAPEMVLGAEIDERTDVYLLGATLHEILTGQPRHAGATVREVVRAALRSEPFAYGPLVPEALASLCNRATARDRTKRPASARAFREEIVHFQRQQSTQALCQAALERLRTLEELLGAPELGVPSDLPLAYRLATEARFALKQSQNAGGGELASEAMHRCLAALVDLELRQGHADSAEALLREMNDPPPALAERVAVVRERDAGRERERARLETLARDLDPSALAAKRTRWILGSSLAVALIWLLTAIRGRPPTLGWLLIVNLAGNAVVHGVLALLRRSGANRFNLLMGSLLALGFAMSFANRAFAYFVAGTTLQVLTVDLVVFATITAAAGIVLYRGMWFVAVVFGCGLAAIRLWPAQGPRIFAFAIVGALLAGAMALARASNTADKID